MGRPARYSPEVRERGVPSELARTHARAEHHRSIRLLRLPAPSRGREGSVEHEPARGLLRQRPHGELLQHLETRARPQEAILESATKPLLTSRTTSTRSTICAVVTQSSEPSAPCSSRRGR